jgi:hypothetical protein
MSYQQSRTRNVHFLAARLMGDGRKLPLANIFRIAYYLSFPNWLGLIFNSFFALIYALCHKVILNWVQLCLLVSLRHLNFLWDDPIGIQFSGG